MSIFYLAYHFQFSQRGKGWNKMSYICDFNSLSFYQIKGEACFGLVRSDRIEVVGKKTEDEL